MENGLFARGEVGKRRDLGVGYRVQHEIVVIRLLCLDCVSVSTLVMIMVLQFYKEKKSSLSTHFPFSIKFHFSLFLTFVTC